MNALRASSFIFLCWSNILVYAENTTTAAVSDGKQAKVGWIAGPTQRGTLMLIYGCLSTVFASTWTVLHLNVPAPSDGVWTRTLRKGKWMAITILFPEFIFSKAICELRLAVADLYAMHVKLEKYRILWNTTVELRNAKIHTNWTWKAEFGPCMRFLYKLLLISPRASKQEQDELQDNSSVRESHLVDQIRISSESNNERQYPNSDCNWTLVHSFYANMGGLLYISNNSNDRHPATAHGIIEECYQGGSCPLKEFILEKKDIEDKSKADWLLKAIAVSQILWLILNVASRGITKLPVTQLEIATIAFSLMAVATYAANWGKPKDIVTPTVLRRPTTFLDIDKDKRNLQGFVKRLLVPSKANGNIFHESRNRIENDVIWMEGDIPLISSLMAMSSLVFGGLHCLAWNFDFPTGTELMLWRVASLVSGALPGFALGVSLLIGFLSTSFADNMRTSSILKILAPIERFPPAWWDLLEQIPEDWDKELPEGKQNDNSMWLVDNWNTLNDIRNCMIKAKEGTRDFKLHTKLSCNVGWLRDRENNVEAAEIWDKYEEDLKTKIEFAGPENPPTSCLGFILKKKARVEHLQEGIDKLKQMCNQASKFLTISSGILYTIARVTILVLLFTSLRSVPEGIYETTSWTRFLPNIS